MLNVALIERVGAPTLAKAVWARRRVMNRQLRLTKRSLGHSALRSSMGVVVLQSALLVSACSDDSFPGTLFFATSTDTFSSSASSTTNATLVLPTTTLMLTLSATMTQTTTT